MFVFYGALMMNRPTRISTRSAVRKQPSRHDMFTIDFVVKPLPGFISHAMQPTARSHETMPDSSLKTRALRVSVFLPRGACEKSKRGGQMADHDRKSSNFEAGQTKGPNTKHQPHDTRLGLRSPIRRTQHCRRLWKIGVHLSFILPYLGVQELPRKKQALVKYRKAGATTEVMGNVQLTKGMLQTQHAIAFI